MFEGKSIKAFNTSFFLQYIKQLQTEAYFEIVSLRWDAIQEYFNGRLDLCIKHLNESLEMAKRSNQASWIINDIRIDLRNQHFAFCTERNSYSESEAQKELNSSTDELYYPIIDRSSESLQEKYIQGLFKKKVRSPYTVSLGSDLNEYGKLLATIFIVALFNGSLGLVWKIAKAELNQQNRNGGNVNESEKRRIQFVISGGDPAKPFELLEEAFNQMTLFI